MTYAEKISSEERRLDLTQPAADLAAKVRALTPHIGAYLELEGGERLGRARGARGRAPMSRRGRSSRRVGDDRSWSAAATGDAAARRRPARRRQSDGRRRLPARPPGADVRMRPAMPVEAPRALAFETLRETFERHAHTELVFRAGAERLGLVGRDRAQAQRLAYGSVQRRGTSDAAIEKLSRAGDAAARPAGRGGAAARPLRAAVRRRDPRPRRRRPGGRAGQDRQGRATRPASSTRSCGARRANGRS